MLPVFYLTCYVQKTKTVNRSSSRTSFDGKPYQKSCERRQRARYGNETITYSCLLRQSFWRPLSTRRCGAIGLATLVVTHYDPVITPVAFTRRLDYYLG